MTFKEYSIAAAKTAKYPKDVGLAYTILGLVGEAGELANKYKKVLRGDTELTEDLLKAMQKEAGDCQWYLSAICDELGTTLEQVAKENIVKLASRDERGVIKGSGDNR